MVNRYTRIFHAGWKGNFPAFLSMFLALFFFHIWPLAGPNIAEKGAALVEKLTFQAVIKSAASAARHADGGAQGVPANPGRLR